MGKKFHNFCKPGGRRYKPPERKSADLQMNAHHHALAQNCCDTNRQPHYYMEYVYYKGERYEAKLVEIGGNRLFSLYNEDGTLVHFVTEQQLDKRSLIDVCIETYLRFSERP